jgi:hypothetical protein
MDVKRRSLSHAMSKEHGAYKRNPGKFPGGIEQVNAIAYSKAGESKPDVVRRTKKRK